MWSLVFKILLLALIAFSDFPVAIGGTGVGNHFVPREEPAFDFHLAHPKAWMFEAGGEAKQSMLVADEVFKRWHLSNKPSIKDPSKESRLDVQFLLNFPAEDEAGKELLAEITERHKGEGITWQKVEDSSFIGYTSGDRSDGNGATVALEYYLVSKRQVIRLEYRKDAHGNGAAEVELILRSIDRSSSGPVVLSIATDKEAYEVGDVACYYVEVDDLKGSFSNAGVEAFEIEGTSPIWSFKSIKWIGEKNWYQVCFAVTRAFGTDGLKIKRITIDNNRSSSTACQTNRDGQVYCGMKQVPAKIGQVNNSAPDRVGPKFVGVDFDKDKLLVDIHVTDESHVGSVVLKIRHGGDAFEHVVFADELVDSHARVDLRKFGRPGWNLVHEVIAVDRNGIASGLILPKSSEQAFYDFGSTDGKRTSTQFPIVNFLRP